MPVQVSLEIAGVRLAVGCPDPIVLNPPPPAYASFLMTVEESARDVDIRIGVEVGGLPGTEGLTPVFDTEQTWSMMTDGEDYFLGLYPAAPDEEPLWIARFARDVSRVHVFCGHGLVSEEGGTTRLETPVRYPLDQLLLMYYLAPRQGVLMHAAGVQLHGKGFIFPGRSGAGKSTIARCLEDCSAAILLSDDRIVLRRIGGEYTIFGTPWPGEAGIAENRCAPLNGIFLLRHGEEDRIDPVTPQRAVERLLPVLSIPWYDRETMPMILEFLDGMLTAVPVYDLHFRPTAEVAHVLDQFASA